MENEAIDFDFNPIRPFYDDEVPAAIGRLLEQPAFHTALKFIFPEVPTEQMHQMLKQINSVDDFQEKIISQALSKIIDGTTEGISVGGINKLNKKNAHLFISNHRDIVLDSAFLNYQLFLNNFPTTRIAIGSNLLQKPWIEDLVKLNKNFIVHRDVQSRLAYIYSMRLSRFIGHSLLNENISVWIAQKEGRSKEGKDRTHAGLIKMFGMASDWDDPAELYHSLRISPVSISYETEPCGGYKAREMYMRKQLGQYQKQEGEDLQSMKAGISGNKGKVHFEFSAPLDLSDIKKCFDGFSKNDAVKNLANLIDQYVISNYKLFPSNYIAYYLKTGDTRFNNYFSASELTEFEDMIEFELVGFEFDSELLKPHLLNIYANPLISKIDFGII